MAYEHYNDKMCVQADVLYGELSLLSYENYKKACIRKRLLLERRACRGQKALVNFGALPEEWKKAIVAKFGDPFKNSLRNSLEALIVKQPAAEQYYREYVYNGMQTLPIEKQREYALNASLLEAIKTKIADRRGFCRKLGHAARAVWPRISDLLNSLAELKNETGSPKYPHSLPTNWRSLQRVMQRYSANGYYALIHGNYGNINSEKINENAKMWVLSRWADQVNRCANENQLFFEYNEMAAANGWKRLESPQALYLFLHREDIQELWWGHRYGELAAKEKFNYQHSTLLPTMRDSLWYSDGTKLNYYYQDEAGKVCTTKVYEVMDAYSGALLGYHIGDKEDYATQYAAFKMAVQVAGHRPYQIGFDNQGGHKKLENGSFIGKVATLAIKTQPYNGKSKTIEAAFNKLQTQFLKQDWFFTGQNIQAKKQESKANLEYINANKANLPTLAEIKRIYAQRREQYNNSLHHKTARPLIEMYNQSHNPAAPAVELWNIVDIFWMLRPESVMYTAYGLTIKEKGEKHTFSFYTDDGMPDLKFHSASIDKSFWVKYDPEDLSSVWLYEKDAQGQLRFVREARCKVDVVRGKQEQTQQDTAFIASVKQLNDAARLERMEKMETILAEHGRSSADYGMNTAPVLGLNSKRKKKAKAAKQDYGAILKAEADTVTVIDRTGDDNDDVDIYSKM